MTDETQTHETLLTNAKALVFEAQEARLAVEGGSTEISDEEVDGRYILAMRAITALHEPQEDRGAFLDCLSKLGFAVNQPKAIAEILKYHHERYNEHIWTVNDAESTRQAIIDALDHVKPDYTVARPSYADDRGDEDKGLVGFTYALHSRRILTQLNANSLLKWRLLAQSGWAEEWGSLDIEAFVARLVNGRVSYPHGEVVAAIGALVDKAFEPMWLGNYVHPETDTEHTIMWPIAMPAPPGFKRLLLIEGVLRDKEDNNLWRAGFAKLDGDHQSKTLAHLINQSFNTSFRIGHSPFSKNDTCAPTLITLPATQEWSPSDA